MFNSSDCILNNQKLSEQFLIDHIEFFDFEDYTMYCFMSEDTIRQLKDYVNWNYVIKYSNISENFKKEFSEYIIDLE